MFLKNKLFLILVSIVLIVIVFWWLILLNRNKEITYKLKNVCVNNNCFEVEIAENFWQQYKGLMFRDNLPENKGMLFIFDKETIHLFWMKNTKIPLDIIWIDSNNKVVYISEFIQPCRIIFCPKINPQINAKYVLEINAGLSRKFNFKIDDELKINN